MSEKKKKGKGCLVAIGIFVGLGVIGAFFSNEEQKEIVKTDKIENDSIALVEIDSLIQIGAYNDSREKIIELLKTTKDTLVTKKAEKLREIALDKKEIADKAKKVKLKKAKSYLRVKADEMEDNTWYYDKSTPGYNNRNSFHVYLGQNLSGNWLRFRVQYYADDWLFINKLIIKTDTNKYTYIPKSTPERDNADGKIWEWIDDSVSESELAMLKDVATSKKVKIRFNGSQYYKDKTVTSNQKRGLRHILDYYELLND